eukprot:gb/GFBE01051260.1/.p1 GENE.gb/GFBE01051260.1/~~gb/GFBE01051260.1/.p1  ORF type:complete len:173 (+),score=50.28 gb/GFBE01051260.1/:1-519(+)
MPSAAGADSLLRRRRQVRASSLLVFAALLGLLVLPEAFIGAPRGQGPACAVQGAALADDAEAAVGLSRRSAAVAALPALLAPTAAWAKRGEMSTKAAIPQVIDTEGNLNEAWEPVDIGESTLVDPNDPKYQQMRIMAEIEKQKAKNEEYDSMSKEEKAQKMCELLGRGCQNT